ncbi:MAG: hypothetical protein ACFBRM_00880 [Pikeienuella sp.]
MMGEIRRVGLLSAGTVLGLMSGGVVLIIGLVLLTAAGLSADPEAAIERLAPAWWTGLEETWDDAQAEARPPEDTADETTDGAGPVDAAPAPTDAENTAEAETLQTGPLAAETAGAAPDQTAENDAERGAATPQAPTGSIETPQRDIERDSLSEASYGGLLAALAALWLGIIAFAALIGGFVAGIFLAALYNVLAGFSGGLRIEVVNPRPRDP